MVSCCRIRPPPLEVMWPMTRLVKFATTMCLSVMALCVEAADAAAPDYQREIAPVLKNRCVRCHGPAVTKARLNLAVVTGVARGGKHGRAVVAGKPEASLLWQRVSSNEMP